jgi:hypothetical protein
MDVKTAFLYGLLDEKVLMEQPEGFEEGQDMVWQLDKSLYGLKQAYICQHCPRTIQYARLQASQITSSF